MTSLLAFILLQVSILGSGPETSIRIFLTSPQHSPGIYRVNVVLKTNPGWHTYWQNPGDSGLPPSIRWTLPDGWQAGSLNFPAPEAFVTPSEVTFGYPDSLWFYQDIKPSDQQITTSVTGSLRWLVCKEECVPGRFSFTLSLPGLSELANAPDPDFPGNLPLLNGSWKQAETGIGIRVPGLPNPTAELRIFPENAGVLELHANPAEREGEEAIWNFQPFSPVTPVPDTFYMVVVWKESAGQMGRRVLINRLQE
ncbi:MAG: hypothetical protein HUU10_05575 [Bacteroidetes bacterium]|nr:hypothetical protein [Bacteroidota bacterium]